MGGQRTYISFGKYIAGFHWRDGQWAVVGCVMHRLCIFRNIDRSPPAATATATAETMVCRGARRVGPRPAVSYSTPAAVALAS